MLGARLLWHVANVALGLSNPQVLGVAILQCSACLASQAATLLGALSRAVALVLICFGAWPLLVFSILHDQPIWCSFLALYRDQPLWNSLALSGHQPLWRSAALHCLALSSESATLAQSTSRPAALSGSHSQFGQFLRLAIPALGTLWCLAALALGHTSIRRSVSQFSAAPAVSCTDAQPLCRVNARVLRCSGSPMLSFIAARPLECSFASAVFSARSLQLSAFPVLSHSCLALGCPSARSCSVSVVCAPGTLPLVLGALW